MADSFHRPIAAHDNSPRNKASDIILQCGLSGEIVDMLNCFTELDDFVETQNFTLIHKIVLGLSGRSLEEEILLQPENVDAVDAMARTPLHWAAARGNEHAVGTLLSSGADPNALDIQWTGPVSYAAERDHLVCVRLLLEAGADPDPIIPGGIRVGSPLNCATRNATNPLVLKTLLDFGADIEASGVDNKTSIIHASRLDNVSFAILLLEYGAYINAVSIAEQTPLTTAITYNSHAVLKLLLDRWSDYSTCPRLKGPHLLQIVALYADVETIHILTSADHFKLKYESDYVISDFATRLRGRLDADESLIQAFDDLMDIINHQPELKKSQESMVEYALLPPMLLDLNDEEGSEYADSDQWFESTTEKLDI